MLNGKKGFIAVTLVMATILIGYFAPGWYTWTVHYTINPLTSFETIVIPKTTGATFGCTCWIGMEELTPTIDGEIVDGEWGDPKFTGEQTSPGPIIYDIYLAHDEMYLYVAAKHVSGDFSIAQSLGLATALNIYIDADNNDGMPDNNDIAIIASDDGLCIPFDPAEQGWDCGDYYTYTASGEGIIIAANGDYMTGDGQVEVAIPLSLIEVSECEFIGMLFQAFGNDYCPVVPDVHCDWPETYTDIHVSLYAEFIHIDKPLWVVFAVSGADIEGLLGHYECIAFSIHIFDENDDIYDVLMLPLIENDVPAWEFLESFDPTEVGDGYAFWCDTLDMAMVIVHPPTGEYGVIKDVIYWTYPVYPSCVSGSFTICIFGIEDEVFETWAEH